MKWAILAAVLLAGCGAPAATEDDRGPVPAPLVMEFSNESPLPARFDATVIQSATIAWHHSFYLVPGGQTTHRMPGVLELTGWRVEAGPATHASMARTQGVYDPAACDGAGGARLSFVAHGDMGSFGMRGKSETCVVT